MNEAKRVNFSDIIAAKLKGLREWLKPDPNDPVALIVVKSVLKSAVMVLLLLFSPVLLIGLFLAFIGLM
jgi:hypothetical protein